MLVALAVVLAAAPPVEATRALELENTNRAEALVLYERACTAKKHQPSCAQWALLIAGTDPKRAFSIAETACKTSDPLSCAVVGLFTLDGTGTSRDENIALQRLAHACEAGLLAACGDDTSYEFEGPGKSMRFTKDRSAVPQRVPWRVFKTSAPDAKKRAAIRFTGQ